MTEKWFKSVGRHAPILVWSAGARTYKEGIQVGLLTWRVSPSIVICNGTPLTYEFESTGPHVWTNLENLLTTSEPSLLNTLEGLEREINVALTLQPASSLEECQSLYKTLKRQSGLMLMAFYLTERIYKHIQRVAPARIFETIKEHITQPYKKAMPARELSEINALRVRFSNGALSSADLSSVAEQLAAQYGFMHAEFIGVDQTAEEYQAEIQNIEGTPAIPHQSETTIDDLRLVWLMKVAGHLAFIFEEAKISFVRSMWCIRKTATALGLDDRAIVNLTVDEFLHWGDTGVLPEGDIVERSRYYVLTLNGAVITESFGKERVAEIIRKEGITEFDEIPEDIRELKGSVAYKGRLRGTVRITLTQQDAKRVQKGDILVASMTTTELLSAMKRAGAFVTDEGGVTSHAAIMAREFKKPCIVGTQVATRVLKDGDFVEVDAERGIVTILKRSLIRARRD